MRILILSCNTGEGHNTAAGAIRQVAEARGDAVEIFDALSYWPAGTNEFICSGQRFLYKNAPSLFGVGYRFLELASEVDPDAEKAEKKKKQTDKAISRLVKKPSAKLYEDLSAGRFDAVICTHVFALVMMTEIRRATGDFYPTFFVATDYTCSPGVNISDFEGCFIPDEGLTEEFVACGVPADRLVATGIPIRAEFYESAPKAEAKARLGLPTDKRAVVLMSGSMGCGPIGRIAKKILKVIPDDTVLVTICGRNERLYEQLSVLPQVGSSLFPVGFTREMSSYMDAAELIITKAGGLSSTEAAAKHLPIVFIDAIPGLEIHNRDFFFNLGLAAYGETPADILEQIERLIGDPEQLERMREGLWARFNHRSAEEICDFVHRFAPADPRTPEA